VSTEVEQFWEQHYGAAERVWSGRANATLVDVVQDLPSGSALDLGCGEGGDAVWLALRGWQVTAVDVSPTALRRAAEHAAQAGVADRVTLERHELGRSFPSGTYDLVCAAFLHSPVELPREDVVRQAAAAVAPGGRLVVLGHAGAPSWAPPEHRTDQHGAHAHFPTPQEVLGALDLPPDTWSAERTELVERTATGPQGQTGHLEDSLVVVRRLT
jgi:SAM-dependent methyltransferase